MTFGKHGKKRRSLEWVLSHERDYLLWAVSEQMHSKYPAFGRLLREAEVLSDLIAGQETYQRAQRLKAVQKMEEVRRRLHAGEAFHTDSVTRREMDGTAALAEESAPAVVSEEAPAPEGRRRVKKSRVHKSRATKQTHHCRECGRHRARRGG